MFEMKLWVELTPHFTKIYFNAAEDKHIFAFLCVALTRYLANRLQSPMAIKSINYQLCN